jgi:hypothetical protein
LPAPAGCTSTISGGLQTALNNAAGGAVICLNSGSYGNISLSSKSYSSVVTVQPATNAAVVLGHIDFTSVGNLHIAGNGGGGATMSVAGHDVDGSSLNLTLDYLTVNGCSEVSNPGFSNVLFDHNRYDNIGPCTYEGRVTVLVASHPAVNLTISNSHFAGPDGGGCSDGVQVIGNGATTISGLQIGPGNEFTNIQQSGCDPVHADPIQFYHGNAVITGNYFHDNSTTVGSFDGDDNSTVSNNVFVYTGYPYSVAAWGGDNWTVTHNTFAGGGELSFRNANSGETPSGNTARDNVWTNGGGIGGSGYTSTYNLNCGCSGTGNVTATAVIVSSPSSGYYHYQLASTSPGYHAASDGKSMGITP